MLYYLFFFNDTATTQIYTLSLHDLFRSNRMGRKLAQESSHSCGLRAPRTALVSNGHRLVFHLPARSDGTGTLRQAASGLVGHFRSEEHTSELQSRGHLVCRLLLEKKKAN